MMSKRVTVVIPCLLSTNPTPALRKIMSMAQERGMDVIISDSPGTSMARNDGARRASPRPEFFVFMDSDLEVTVDLFDRYLPDPGTIFMTVSKDGIWSSRVVAIRSEDFFTLGGYDNALNTAEDKDLSTRAIAKGFHIEPVPSGLYRHVPHPNRRESGKKAVRAIFDEVKVRMRHRKSMDIRRWFWRYEVVPAIRHGKIITLVTMLIAFIFFGIRGVEFQGN